MIGVKCSLTKTPCGNLNLFKIGQYLKSSELKSLFAILLCSVSVAIAYDTFFREGSKEFNGTKVIETDLNPVSEFVDPISLSELKRKYG